MLHFSFLLSVFGFLAYIQSHANHVVHNLLLFVRHGIIHVFHGLLIFVFLSFFGHLRILLFVIGMFKGIIELTGIVFHITGIVIDNALINTSIAMGKHFVDMGLWVSTGQHQAQFSDNSMGHISAALITGILQVIRPNGKGRNVTVLHKCLCITSLVSVVKGHISPHALGLSLQKSMAQNIFGIIMLVVPHKRHFLAVLLSECTWHNCSAIAAKHTKFGGPATAIVITLCHFDSPPWER